MRKLTGGIVSSIFFGEDFASKTIDDEPITCKYIVNIL